jgi:hypothetical protein
MIKNFLFLVIISVFLITFTCYSQTEKIHFGIKYSVKSHQFLMVNDIPNHKMGLASGTGVAFMKDERTANVDVFFIYDYINGAGTFFENYVVHMSDSSLITIKAEGNTYGDEYNPMFTANVTITNGTGSYSGIKGTGKMTGDRKAVLNETTIINLYFDLEYYFGNY